MATTDKSTDNSGDNKNDTTNDGTSNENTEEDPKDSSRSESQDSTLHHSFTSVEVSDGKSEPETLDGQTMAERKEVRRDPTTAWAEGVKGTVFRRIESNPYRDGTSHLDPLTSEEDFMEYWNAEYPGKKND